MNIPILSRFFKSRASPKNSFWQSPYSFFFGSTPSGKTVNERTAMQTSGVYACVRILSRNNRIIAIAHIQTY
jgi:phage portal protein BeeE